MRTSSPEQWLKRGGSGNGKCLKINKMIEFPEVLDEIEIKV